jgi:hypothetical protein
MTEANGMKLSALGVVDAPALDADAPAAVKGAPACSGGGLLAVCFQDALLAQFRDPGRVHSDAAPAHWGQQIQPGKLKRDKGGREGGRGIATN